MSEDQFKAEIAAWRATSARKSRENIALAAEVVLLRASEAVLAKALRLMTKPIERMRALESVYHQHPGMDRPREGCLMCDEIDAALASQQ